jgi:hypothetical protein
MKHQVVLLLGLMVVALASRGLCQGGPTSTRINSPVLTMRLADVIPFRLQSTD